MHPSVFRTKLRTGVTKRLRFDSASGQKHPDIFANTGAANFRQRLITFSCIVVEQENIELVVVPEIRRTIAQLLDKVIQIHGPFPRRSVIASDPNIPNLFGGIADMGGC
jgi:hypothetical protein